MPRPGYNRVLQEIAALIAIKPHVPAQNFFGEDNLASIDAQITVLEDRLDYDSLDNLADVAEWDDSVRDAGHDAVMWLMGDYIGESLADEWKELAEEE